jgi:hypothetical protein
MDVTLPNGKIIRGVPEGTSKDAIRQKAIQAGLAQESDFPTEATPSTRGTIADPVGQGLTLGFSDEIAGALGAIPGSLMTGQSIPEAYRDIRDIARGRQEQFAERNPGTALTAELAGGLVTGGAGLARTGALKAGQGLKQTLGAGAGLGAIQGVGMGEGNMLSDAGKGAATGAITSLLPAGVQQVARRTARGLLSPAMSKVHNKAVDLLENAGVKLTTGQKTGSTRLKSVEGTAGQTFLGGSIRNTLDQQRQDLQSTLMKMSGFAKKDISEGMVTGESLKNAADRFSKRYETLLGNRTVDLNTPTFNQALTRIADDHSQLLQPTQKRAVTQIVGDLRAKATPAAQSFSSAKSLVGNISDKLTNPITGKEYQRIRAQLGRFEKNPDPNIASLYGSMKDALDDAFVSGVSGRAGQVKGGINKQFANFTRLRDAYRSNASAAGGVLPLASIRNAAQKKPSSKEFTELLDAASAVLPDRMPQSGTAPRLADIATFGAGGAGLVADPVTTLTLGGAGLLGSKALASGVGGNVGRAMDPTLAQRLGLLSVPGVNTLSNTGQ